MRVGSVVRLNKIYNPKFCDDWFLVVEADTIMRIAVTIKIHLISDNPIKQYFLFNWLEFVSPLELARFRFTPALCREAATAVSTKICQAPTLTPRDTQRII